MREQTTVGGRGMSLEKVPNFFADFFKPPMNGSKSRIYRFHSFLLDVAERQLFDGERRIPLTPKTFDVLVYLVENGGHLVEKDELLNAVWGDSFVAEVNIPRTVFTLRKALGQDRNGNNFIETVPTKGYRFVAEVRQADANGGDGEVIEAEHGEKPQHSEIPVEHSSPVHISASAGLNDTRRLMRLIFVISAVMLLTAAGGGIWFYGLNGRSGSPQRGTGDQTQNGAAYQAYQQGRLLVNRRRDGDMEEALRHFEKAIELDPNYAAAYAWKAHTIVWIFWATGTHDDISKARSSVQKALQLQPDNSYAHAALCRIKATYDWDFAGAEKDCKRAIELKPDNYDAHHELAMLYLVFGRFDDAHAEIDTAIALSPISTYKRQKALIYFFDRRFPEAIAQTEQVRVTDPEYRYALHWLVWYYGMNREYDKAFEVYVGMVENKESAGSASDVRDLYAAMGWQGILRHLYDNGPPRLKRHWLQIAATLCQLGDKEATFATLEKGYADRKLFMPYLALDPRFDPCRDDPRFESLLKRIGLK